ncbi:MAG: DUF177 domain-containing protein [Rhodobacteraceae bacterium]|nr:DUF177 domain-containing protein [Paracoccaceae bacterium]MCC0066088.1 DUF177 domain-containing protein [Rhodovulum sp.]
MPELATKAPDNPEFARVIDLAAIRDRDEFAFDIRPDPAEARALARLMGAISLRRMRFAGRLTPVAPKGWRLEARLGATVVQPCVVTLDPVTTRIDQDVTRRYLPAAGETPLEVTVDAGEDDEVEPLGPRLDLGLVAIEALALALPAYPRRADAALPPEAVAALGARAAGEAEAKPFAALAALRDKLGNSS